MGNVAADYILLQAGEEAVLDEWAVVQAWESGLARAFQAFDFGLVRACPTSVDVMHESENHDQFLQAHAPEKT